MLIATLRDQGQHPCPHCLIGFEKIHDLGTPADLQRRKDQICKDDETRQGLVKEARVHIFRDGYVVNSDKVDGLLKPTSAVPTIVSFCFGTTSLLIDSSPKCRRIPSPSS